MKRSIVLQRVPAFMVLTLFLGWLGLGVAHAHPGGRMAHAHPGGPWCEICKLMHGEAADLTRPTDAPEPALQNERILLPAENAAADRLADIPRGRAPPPA